MDVDRAKKKTDVSLTALGAMLVVSIYALLVFSGWEHFFTQTGCRPPSCSMLELFAYLDGNRAFRIWGEIGGAKMHLLKALAILHIAAAVGFTCLLYFVWFKPKLSGPRDSMLPSDQELRMSNLRKHTKVRPRFGYVLFHPKQIREGIAFSRNQIRLLSLACLLGGAGLTMLSPSFTKARHGFWSADVTVSLNAAFVAFVLLATPHITWEMLRWNEERKS